MCFQWGWWSAGASNARQERPEAIPLWLEEPPLAIRQSVGRFGEHRQDRRVDGEMHDCVPRGHKLRRWRSPSRMRKRTHRSLDAAPQYPHGSELSEMRHDLFGEQFHVVDLAVEVAGFRAEPE